MTPRAEELKELLVDPGYLEESAFRLAQEKAEEKGKDLERVILEEGLVKREHFNRIIAEHYGCEFIDLDKEVIDKETLNLISEEVAASKGVVVFGFSSDGNLKIATSDPLDYKFIKDIEKKTGYNIETYYADPLGIDLALKNYSGIKDEIEKIIKDLKSKTSGGSAEEENIVKLVDLVLEYAADKGASDIHIEPLEEETRIRFRIDGVLHKMGTFPSPIHSRVVARLKIISGMRTDEHAAPQDGAFSFEKERYKFDIRISVLPITEGENVVMRLLMRGTERYTLEEIGLSKKDLSVVKKEFERFYGMILVVGPTGSGKTTTLYSVLQILNRPEFNIMSIEDPVEYNIEGVHQTQVNPKKNLTFATGLRSLVRQDPDIMMIGEIRDEESANIGINSAMTGHLVLSTLHATDAATSFPRFYEMGIEPFLLASSVNVIIAQRLVRKICSKCRISHFMGEEERVFFQEEPEFLQLFEDVSGTGDISKTRIFKGKGCDLCAFTGYKGRTAIFEVMSITENIRPLIIAKESTDVIRQKAVEEGMTPMVKDGLEKVLKGVTTLEEMLRAVRY